MKDQQLKDVFLQAIKHRQEHLCGGYPYENTDILAKFIPVNTSMKILELGTGIGYTSAYMANISKLVLIDTIDQDSSHGELALKNWQDLKIMDQISLLLGKAETILPELIEKYDLIFFDGYSPSMKFLLHFERLLKKNGILITANMFLKDELGGKYMRSLSQKHRWQLDVFEDTTIAIKLF